MTRTPYSPRPSTVPSNSPSPKMIRSPVGIFRPGRTRVSQVSGESCRTRRTSMGACRNSLRAGLLRPGLLCVNSHPAPEKPRRHHAGVVDHDQFIAAQQGGEFAEMAILPSAGERGRAAACARRRAPQADCCAIRSGGRSKLNSLRFIVVMLVRRVRRGSLRHWLNLCNYAKRTSPLGFSSCIVRRKIASPEVTRLL